MPKKVTVVISQAQGRNPQKRDLEEEIAATLLGSPDIDISLIPHLYDLTPDHSGMLFLKGIPGDMIVCSWLYPRAAHWALDRAGVKGMFGQTLLKSGDDDSDEDDEDGDGEEQPANPDAIGALNVPKRRIYSLDLRGHSSPQAYIDEIRRIAREATVPLVDLLGWVQGQPKAEQMQRYLNPVISRNGSAAPPPVAAPAVPEEPVKRRWYPVIDYSRCTNCMECIDFCLFGVYGVDTLDRILVEQQDNCKKGCPACSRVCPANAIIFPEHKTPGIAGSDTESASNLKIDLSKLFGAPSALEEAVFERDRELVADGREAVGMGVGIPKRQTGCGEKPRDNLDDLMDSLDNLL